MVKKEEGDLESFKKKHRKLPKDILKEYGDTMQGWQVFQEKENQKLIEEENKDWKTFQKKHKKLPKDILKEYGDTMQGWKVFREEQKNKKKKSSKHHGLPEDIVKKYGVTKKAWEVFRKKLKKKEKHHKGLPEDIVKKYGVTKKAWEVFRKREKEMPPEHRGLPKDIIKKYGMTKKAWEVFRERELQEEKEKLFREHDIEMIGNTYTKKLQISPVPKIVKQKIKTLELEKTPSLKLKDEAEIAMDFSIKVYRNFNKMIKSIVLFGSSTKKTSTAGSDIDIIIIVDDVSINWDPKLITWYREELDRILRANPYKKGLHINTVKLSTWWEDLMRGDPVILNMLRFGESIIDFGGFFEPLKFLLLKGKIRATPEAIYTSLQRAPAHIQRSKFAELGSIEGLYWAMVDSAHAALIADGISPPSPEHIADELRKNFVNRKKLKSKYVQWYEELLKLHKEITHGIIHDLKGVEIDMHQERAEEFLEVMANLVKEIVGA